MKTCPKCGATYDNETLLFCTRDGTPLVEEGRAPEFTDMPSESWEEDTVIISKSSIPAPDSKIVVPMSEPEATPSSEPNFIRPNADPQRRVPPPFQPPPQKPRILLTIVVTALCTIGVVALALGAWWAINGGSGTDLPANGNLDANLFNNNANANFNANMFNANYNANMMNIDMNANFNANANFNLNTNFNSNANFSNANFNANSNVNKPTPTPKPSVTPKASPTETPDDGDDSPTPGDTLGTINAGMLNSRAQNLPQPAYPPAAKAANVTGSVNVAVTIDESGRVISARATSGPLLLRAASEAAARQARFNPPRMGTQPVKMSGVLLYTFQ